MDEMIQQVKEVFTTIDNDNEFFNTVARLCRKAREALEKEGFTRQEALSIISNYAAKK
jgi:hypothetical protein